MLFVRKIIERFESYCFEFGLFVCKTKSKEMCSYEMEIFLPVVFT